MTMYLRPAELVNLAGTDTGRESLSHTRLGVLLACHQKFKWSYEENLEPAVKKVSLTMGSAFAHALELGDPEAGYRMVMEERDALALEHQGPFTVIPTEADAETQATIVRAASRTYLEHYGVQDVQREITMRARVRNPATGRGSNTFDVQARVDGLAGDRLIEDKFVGRVDTVTDRKLMLDRQVTLGCYLVWRTTGQVIREVSYRMTKKPGIKQTQKETHADYLARVDADYAARPEFYLHEFTLTRTPEDFLRLEQELWTWSEQIRAARRDGAFPRNTAACSEYGGCPYLALCVGEPGAIHQFVERAPRETTTEFSITRKDAA
jgi:hypothetical protein